MFSDLSLVGHQFQSRSAGRAKSKAILEELEAEGLISGAIDFELTSEKLIYFVGYSVV